MPTLHESSRDYRGRCVPYKGRIYLVTEHWVYTKRVNDTHWWWHSLPGGPALFVPCKRAREVLAVLRLMDDTNFNPADRK